MRRSVVSNLENRLLDYLLVKLLTLSRGQNTPKLIVNADDYGMTSGVSAGIRRAHIKGIVTSASVIMNFDNAVSAINMARTECPQLGLGVHLNLTQGTPVLPEACVPTLVANDGHFYSVTEINHVLAYIDLNQLYDEWKAQIERFLKTGAMLDHLDSHHHVAFRTPKFVSILSQLAIEYNVPVRIPFSLEEQSQEDVIILLRELAPAVRRPAGMFRLRLDRYDSLRRLLRAIDRIRGTMTMELMCHPGFADEELRRLSGSYCESREQELALLTSKELKNRIRRRRIELVTFRSVELSNKVFSE